MADHVFIFGAGASASAGVPMMNDFMNKAIDLAEESGDVGFQESVKSVRKAREELRKIFSNSFLDLDNFESVYGAIEMSKILGSLGHFSGEDIQDFQLNIKKMISFVIEYSSRFPLQKDSNGLPFTPGSSDNYMILLDQLKKYGFLANTVFITFNYDILLDVAIERVYSPSWVKVEAVNGTFDRGFKNIDYCLNQNSSSEHEIKLLKLHGSINWGYCQSCGKCYELNQVNFVNPTVPRKLTLQDHTKLHFLPGCQKTKCPECETNLEPMIVPPTFSKSNYHQQLSHVWKAASEAIKTAKHITIIGYSLPDSDSFFQYFYALSTLNLNSDIRSFHVINPDNGIAIRERYKKIVGPSIHNIYKYYPSIFHGGEVNPKSGFVESRFNNTHYKFSD